MNADAVAGSGGPGGGKGRTGGSDGNAGDEVQPAERAKAQQHIMAKLSATFPHLSHDSLREYTIMFEGKAFEGSSSRLDYLHRIAEGLSSTMRRKQQQEEQQQQVEQQQQQQWQQQNPQQQPLRQQQQQPQQIQPQQQQQPLDPQKQQGWQHQEPRPLRQTQQGSPRSSSAEQAVAGSENTANLEQRPSDASDASLPLFKDPSIWNETVAGHAHVAPLHHVERKENQQQGQPFHQISKISMNTTNEDVGRVAHGMIPAEQTEIAQMRALASAVADAMNAKSAPFLTSRGSNEVESVGGAAQDHVFEIQQQPQPKAVPNRSFNLRKRTPQHVKDAISRRQIQVQARGGSTGAAAPQRFQNGLHEQAFATYSSTANDSAAVSSKHTFRASARNGSLMDSDVGAAARSLGGDLDNAPDARREREQNHWAKLRSMHEKYYEPLAKLQPLLKSFHDRYGAQKSQHLQSCLRDCFQILELQKLDSLPPTLTDAMLDRASFFMEQLAGVYSSVVASNEESTNVAGQGLGDTHDEGLTKSPDSVTNMGVNHARTGQAQTSSLAVQSEDILPAQSVAGPGTPLISGSNSDSSWGLNSHDRKSAQVRLKQPPISLPDPASGMAGMSATPLQVQANRPIENVPSQESEEPFSFAALFQRMVYDESAAKSLTDNLLARMDVELRRIFTERVDEACSVLRRNDRPLNRGDLELIDYSTIAEQSTRAGEGAAYGRGMARASARQMPFTVKADVMFKCSVTRGTQLFSPGNARGHIQGDMRSRLQVILDEARAALGNSKEEFASWQLQMGHLCDLLALKVSSRSHVLFRVPSIIFVFPPRYRVESVLHCLLETPEFGFSELHSELLTQFAERERLLPSDVQRSLGATLHLWVGLVNDFHRRLEREFALDLEACLRNSRDAQS
ncbi:hypothetical protein FVE85_8333 [Porphyridium purpureum]|uniref:Mediator complex subunit 15 KIX domain-containing protein n=1 Tax=Porphyridium purpureum TaxID=35688 RepID=A0A5J4YK74_PORPP|nr:hypothetical protein FVE85_8333 [Porphyridium purpureum]|eukprot:POR1116..scf244_11